MILFVVHPSRHGAPGLNLPGLGTDISGPSHQDENSLQWEVSVLLAHRAPEPSILLVFQSCGLVAKLCPTLQLRELQPARLLCPWDSPGKNSGVDCHGFLHYLLYLTALSGIEYSSFSHHAPQEEPDITRKSMGSPISLVIVGMLGTSTISVQTLLQETQIASGLIPRTPPPAGRVIPCM